MGYAQEYHVERYFRECLVPRIAPVSRVSYTGSNKTSVVRADLVTQEMILNFVGEKVLGFPRSY